MYSEFNEQHQDRALVYEFVLEIYTILHEIYPTQKIKQLAVHMGGNFRGAKILCYFEEAIILNFRGC